ncbi:hypothetical protein [Rhodoblastus sp.]|uniref:hypothetical protein n=1 Tax=Rhodoblastus sp. TaxID=1962975 RepID=UPI003F9B5640
MAVMKALLHTVVLSAVIALSGLAMASEAHAGGGASLKSCAASFKAICGSVKPGGGRIQACFDSNIDKLSEPCRSKLTKAASSARACQADVRKLCGGAAHATGTISCMKPRLAQVGIPCKRAMAKVAIQYSRGQ